VSLDRWLLLEVGETTRQPVRWCTVIRSGQLQFILVPTEDKPEGLTDKLYWRKAKGEWHCFHTLAQVRAGCSFRKNPNRYEGMHANAL
jgi:hypothetical protein